MKLNRTYILISLAVLFVVAAAVFLFVGGRAKASQADDASLEPAAAVLAEPRPITNSVILSGDFRPFQEVDVHAKIAGYIRNIYVDVGDQSKRARLWRCSRCQSCRLSSRGPMPQFVALAMPSAAPKAISSEPNRCIPRPTSTIPA